MTQLPAIGDKPPLFSLPVTDGGVFDLAAHLGRSAVVLFFYPKDDTSGCTVENIDFSALYEDFRKDGIIVVGVSPDPLRKHERFRAKHALTVPLVADEEKQALEAYGVWVEKSMYGRKYMGVERSTFLIGQDGRIARVWRKVKVPGHAKEVLEAARALD